MALVPIDISKGAFHSVDPFEVNNSGFASLLENVVINDAGTNVSRPALSLFSTVSTYPINGLALFNGYVVAVTTERKIYGVSSAGVSTNITGTVLASDKRPVFANDGTYIAIAGGGAPRRWDGVITNNTALLAGSPVSCSHISYLDGYWINHVLNGQEFRWAGPTSTLRGTFTATDFFQAEGLPDNIAAQAVNLRELYAFGTESTEIFQNFGDTSVPFRRTFFIDNGTVAPYSVIQADNTLWWLDSYRRFVQLQGRTPVSISTPELDSTVQGFSTVTDCWAAKVDIDGYYLLVWSFPTEERTFVYDYRLKYWSEWKRFANQSAGRFRIHSHVYVPAWNKHLVGDYQTGKIWQLTFSSHADGSDVRRVVRRTGSIDHGTYNRKRSMYYEIEVGRGLGTPGSTEPVFEVRVKDDDRPWGEPTFVGLGYTGDALHSVRVAKPGIYRRRQMEIVFTDAVQFKLKSIRENVEVMTS